MDLSPDPDCPTIGGLPTGHRMSSKNGRLDRLLARRLQIDIRSVQRLLASARVQVDGVVARDRQQIVGPFNRILLDAEVLQSAQARYIMLNKPTGVVSATRDARHVTVLDLLAEQDRAGLHIAGRLDFHSTGLVLLSNDGRWSRALSAPCNQVSKRYRVTLQQPLRAQDVQAFAEGMYFSHEGITTRPALLRILASHQAEVCLTEGRYRQIRRMFARLDNRVLALHRSAIGAIELDDRLLPGQSRALTAQEVSGACDGSAFRGFHPAGD
jgi:16S rRNA pseudouridine516 synthase